MALTEMICAVVAMGCATGVLVCGIDMFTGRRRGRPVTAADAEAILAERFARGEIDEDEYADRLGTLRMGPPLQIR